LALKVAPEVDILKVESALVGEADLLTGPAQFVLGKNVSNPEKTEVEEMVKNCFKLCINFGRQCPKYFLG
jgi:hypothetical protein